MKRGAPRGDCAGTGFGLLRIIVFIGLSGVAVMVVGIVLFALSLDRREPLLAISADGVVVLTGGADRIHDALELMKSGKGRRLMISGVNAQSTMEMLRRRWPGHDGLFACCIDLDYQARNTYENAIESRRWVREKGFRSLILVTASYHLPRARLEFRHAMPEIELYSYPVVPEASRLSRWWQDPVLLRIIILEFFKYCAANVRIVFGLPGGIGFSGG
jgi:uncharacterized SAM-binding protein YcdF (DUF218 family)